MAVPRPIKATQNPQQLIHNTARLSPTGLVVLPPAGDRSLEAVIETGRLISTAKAALPHGAFTAMVENDLPFGPRTAQILMKVAADSRITNPKFISLLPSSWATLSELTKLDDKQFQSRIKDGTIHPEMERRDIATIIKKEARAKREADLGIKQMALPNKRYGVVVADPEWKDEVWSEDTGMDRHASNHYPTSDAKIIAARDVGSIAAKDCVLFLWTTNQHLRIAIGVMEAWSFEYKSNYCWGKNKISTGRWNRSKHELLLIGTRGNVPCPSPGTQWDSVIEAPVGAHSAKPECFLEMIEAYYPTLPKIELNRRGAARDGWCAWGLEAVQS